MNGNQELGIFCYVYLECITIVTHTLIHVSVHWHIINARVSLLIRMYHYVLCEDSISETFPCFFPLGIPNSLGFL